MQSLRQLGGGVIIALVSIILVIGGISLALAESQSLPTAIPTRVPPTLQVFFPTATFAFATQTGTPTETPTLLLPSPTLFVPTPCTAAPSGWFQIVVNVNETIYQLAQRYKTSEDSIKNANCLPSYEIQAGNVLYVPPVVATAPPIVCGPPATWVRAYVVQSGDNLFRISLLYRTTVPQLQSANCMGSSITIYTGQRLWVPNVPTSTPGVTLTLIFSTSTTSFTSTPIPPTLTAWPTSTSTFISTSSPIPTATQTSAPTATIYVTPSLTPFPSP